MSSSTTPLHRSGEFFRKTAFLHRSSLRTKFSTLAQISGWFARYLALLHRPLGLSSNSIVFSAKDCRSWHLLLCFFLYFSFLHFFSNTVFNCFDSTLPHSSGCFALYFGLLQSDLLILSFLFFFPFPPIFSSFLPPGDFSSSDSSSLLNASLGIVSIIFSFIRSPVRASSLSLPPDNVIPETSIPLTFDSASFPFSSSTKMSTLSTTLHLSTFLLLKLGLLHFLTSSSRLSNFSRAGSSSGSAMLASWQICLFLSFAKNFSFLQRFANQARSLLFASHFLGLAALNILFLHLSSASLHESLFFFLKA